MNVCLYALLPYIVIVKGSINKLISYMHLDTVQCFPVRGGPDSRLLCKPQDGLLLNKCFLLFTIAASACLKINNITLFYHIDQEGCLI